MFNYQHFRHLLYLIIPFFLIIVLCPTIYAQNSEPVMKVAFLYDGPNELSDKLADEVEAELALVSEGKYTLAPMVILNGQWNTTQISNNIKKTLARSDIQLIIANGIFTSQELINSARSTPVVLANLFDPKLINLESKNNRSSIPNLTYIEKKETLISDLDLFHKIAPFKTVHVLIDQMYFPFAKKIINKAKGYKIKLISYKQTALSTFDNLKSNGVKAVYLTPTNRLNPFEYKDLILLVNQEKIPSFSMNGIRDVEAGVLASQTPRFLKKLVRRVALNSDQILEGKAPSTLDVDFDWKAKLVLNRQTASLLDVAIPFDSLLDADILYEDKAGGEKLTIYRAVEDANKNNLSFRIIDEQIKQSRYDHLTSWSSYLPQLDFNLDYQVNDSETARNIVTSNKEFFQYSFTLGQVIFSDPLIRDIRNSKKQIQVRNLEKTTQTLDITDQTAKAYLNYLRAKALLKVEREDLRSIEQHLQMATKRVKVGSGGPDEVYRWNSEKAETQSTVLRRKADVFQSKIILNQLMNLPQELALEEEDVGLETIDYYLGSQYMRDLITDLKKALIFVNHMVVEGFDNSPELEALSIGIAQQKITKSTSLRRFVLPEASLLGELSHKIHKKNLAITGAPSNDSDDWSLFLNVNYPIFEGGNRIFDSLKQNSEVYRLVYQQELKMQQIELTIRAAAYDMYHTLPSIELLKESLRNASENLILMEKKYTNGTASITDLIDAQNEKFRREGQAVISIYDFLADLYSFDRGISNFYSLSSIETRKNFYERIQTLIN